MLSCLLLLIWFVLLHNFTNTGKDRRAPEKICRCRRICTGLYRTVRETAMQKSQLLNILQKPYYVTHSLQTVRFFIAWIRSAGYICLYGFLLSGTGRRSRASSVPQHFFRTRRRIFLRKSVFSAPSPAPVFRRRTCVHTMRKRENSRMYTRDHFPDRGVMSGR